MNVLVVGINYAPEMVGIGPYTAGMAEFLVEKGHAVTVICAPPYYPDWKVKPGYDSRRRCVSIENGVRVVRVPTYIPARPNGWRRLAHHASFAASARLAVATEARLSKPDVVIAIAPSLISVTAARDAAQRAGAKLWLHVQDFEVEAAFATGLLLEDGMVGSAAKKFEKWMMHADKISTISPQMCARLLEKGVEQDRVVEFRNWANLEEVAPLDRRSLYFDEWGIDRKYVALYSGNIANKQGIEIVVDAARMLSSRKDLIFIVCGNGTNRHRLEDISSDLDNIQFHDLQPRERLSELLSMATVHLLPQIAEAADLVLPSKLTNMLASGRPIVATAAPGTGLANEVGDCGVVTPPGESGSFASAIGQLLDAEEWRIHAGRAARKRAVERWGRQAILQEFERALAELTSEPRAAASRVDHER
ncbi:WcaI family glycosyltransferase [Novosphingobium cyanobacteriorum]|uniref:WcaI family glycosyltransferase n=1 Tax=Novosphingobium cyanobacteriorum TaxID=3024215 RepID=A0ABT6CNA8_9SPHN|nr:WcaI family glycosyltransferase [Novosphingobium cyanobacteriorum]MDF8334999.1 WcaI family glycosyltransferase [Novosphingobium cyanobacteriorum]